MITVAELDALDRPAFAAVVNACFERAPWVAERLHGRRPFGGLDALRQSLVEVLGAASEPEKIALVAGHPDLVGRLAREGRVSADSASEQAAAGLDRLTATECEQFDRYNTAYRDRFGFPFVICARENRKEAILRAFPVRLAQSREEEIATALVEVGRIAWLRLRDRVREDL